MTIRVGPKNRGRRSLEKLLRATKGLELSAAGANLLQNRHPEFGTNVLWKAGEVERSVSGKLSWWF